jgi:FdhD protein
MVDDHLGDVTDFDVISVKNGTVEETKHSVATEVPCTIVVNDSEVATIMCTPTHLKEFAVGYLYTSGMINSAHEVTAFCYDDKKWRLDVTTPKEIDFALLGKRVYTSGCGRGVMYSNVIMLSSRHPLESHFHVEKRFVSQCVKWLLSCSSLYKETRGVHTAALSVGGELPAFYLDDIGRHNAVDKVIGRSLMDNADFSKSILITTGRISSEILHKVKRTGIPIVLSRGAPTHQTVLMARQMGVTVIGFARRGSFTIYANSDRVLFQEKEKG